MKDNIQENTSHKKDNTSKILIVIIVLLLVCISGGIGYWYGTITTQTTTISTKLTTPTPTTDPYADWKSYTDSDEKFSFKYPSTWTRKDNTLTSPNNFMLTFSTGVSGVGGACDDECAKDEIENVTLAELSFYTEKLYVVVNGTKSTKANPVMKFNVIPRTSCYSNICYGFEGKNSDGIIIIQGRYDTYMSAAEFIKSEDVNTAVSILKTLTY